MHGADYFYSDAHPGTLLKTDYITDIFLQFFLNYSQLPSYLSYNCDQLPVKLPRSLLVNTSPI